uniref:Nipped-B protein n=1 Tax=Micrurus paraensis TaxID=1970185 RepID=A0A2D4K5F4_9SAUR
MKDCKVGSHLGHGTEVVWQSLHSDCYKKYVGIIHFVKFQMKAVAGMKMSYQVQQAINTCRKDPVRGFRQDESSSALCSHLYSMIRGNRQHRRAFLISLLNLFDDTAVSLMQACRTSLECPP